AAFDASPLARRADVHAAMLWNGTASASSHERAPDWWATQSAERSLAPDILQRRDEATLFGWMGPTLWGTALLALFLLIKEGISLDRAAASPLFSLFAADVLAGGALLLVANMMGQFQVALIHRVAATVDGLFPVITGNTVLSAVRDLLRRDGETRAQSLT